jgi:hypothetical protein
MGFGSVHLGSNRRLGPTHKVEETAFPGIHWTENGALNALPQDLSSPGIIQMVRQTRTDAEGQFACCIGSETRIRKGEITLVVKE